MLIEKYKLVTINNVIINIRNKYIYKDIKEILKWIKKEKENNYRCK